MDARSIEPIGGDVVGGRYKLLDRLGEGAAGTVWLARDTRLEIDVAVKVLRRQLVTSDAILQRFVREADVSERMLSPNIVKVLSRGAEAGAPYIVYEHLDGEDLFGMLERVGTLSVPDLEAVIVHTCRALSRAHSVGVLHRDVKPENLFVRADDEGHLHLKVLDFGVAELLGHTDAVDAIVGTPEYMAPEVILGEAPPSPQSDLYALGVVAYQCCTGAMPFEGESLGELLVTLAKGTFEPPSTRREGLPGSADAWFRRALHRQPGERFASAKEMAEQAHLAFKRADTVENHPRRSVTSEIVRVPPSLPRPPLPSFVFEEPISRPSGAYSIIRGDGGTSE